MRVIVSIISSSISKTIESLSDVENELRERVQVFAPGGVSAEDAEVEGDHGYQEGDQQEAAEEEGGAVPSQGVGPCLGVDSRSSAGLQDGKDSGWQGRVYRDTGPEGVNSGHRHQQDKARDYNQCVTHFWSWLF